MTMNLVDDAALLTMEKSNDLRSLMAAVVWDDAVLSAYCCSSE